jgi:hypothetical protein
MPLQEARRQRRQSCGEGVVHLHLLASGPDDASTNPEQLIEQYPQGQLLIAGWGGAGPAARFRELARDKRLYAETYLAAVYPTDSETRAVVIVALPDAVLPSPNPRPIARLIPLLPPGSIVLAEKDLPVAPRAGDFETYARTMSLWEQLHTPFLAAADAEPDPLRKMDGYRRAIAVDYACELAHQKLSAVARDYARLMRGQRQSANLPVR